MHLTLSPIFGRHLVVVLLVLHQLLGFRRLREVDYYRDDPIVLRLMGLRRLQDEEIRTALLVTLLFVVVVALSWLPFVAWDTTRSTPCLKWFRRRERRDFP